MTDPRAFESRIAALLSVYADQMPIDVEPLAVARSAAAAKPLARTASLEQLLGGRRTLLLGLAVLALSAATLGGLVLVGGQPEVDAPLASATPTLDPTYQLVYAPPSPEPSIPTTKIGFVGLPPDGAAPSLPETGELVVSFSARPRWREPFEAVIAGIHDPIVFVGVYADGRLIWQLTQGSLPFGATAYTTGLLEQRLSQEGVELLRREALASGPFDRDQGAINGFWWGSLRAWNGTRLVDVSASRVHVGSILVEPRSWLPASAWEDPEIRAFVPSAYGVCLDPDEPAALPPNAQDIIQAGGPMTGLTIAGTSQAIGDECYELATEDARQLAEALEAAGLRQPDVLRPGLVAADIGLSYEIPMGLTAGTVIFEAILPDGSLNCTGCG